MNQHMNQNVNHQQRTVLLIEDEEGIREVLAEYLELEDFCVVQAGTGNEGLDAARTYRPDIIVSDIGLPDIDGITVVETLRAEGFTIPVIALTAEISIARRIESGVAGAAHYISKPAHPQKVLDLIRTIFAQNG